MGFVKHVGAAPGANTTTMVITVPAGGVPVGNLVMVRTGQPGAGSSTPTVTDTRGNTYTLAVSHTTLGSNFVFRGLITTALVAGDTITATFSVMGNRVMAADEFSAVNNVEDGEASASGTSTSPSTGAISPANATDLIFAHVVVEGGSGDSYTEDSDNAGGDTWHTLTRASNTTLCTSNAAYKITTSAVSQSYDPTISPSDDWIATIVALQETVLPKGAPRPVIVSQAVHRASRW